MLLVALDHERKKVRDPRPVIHETEAETKTNYCETETETKKWCRDLLEARDHPGLEILTSLGGADEALTERYVPQ